MLHPPTDTRVTYYSPLRPKCIRLLQKKARPGVDSCYRRIDGHASKLTTQRALHHTYVSGGQARARLLPSRAGAEERRVPVSASTTTGLVAGSCVRSAVHGMASPRSIIGAYYP